MKKMLILLIVPFFLSGCGCGCENNIENRSSIQDGKRLSLAEEWGVEIRKITLRNEGKALDFRYEVVDRSRAKDLLYSDAEYYLIDQKSGKAFVPSLHRFDYLVEMMLNPKEGKSYFVVFSNPDNQIRHGDKVTVVIDNLKIPDLMVH